MMESENEKIISRLFAELPRRVLSLSSKDKELVWQKIQNHLRETRAQNQREKSLPFWQYLLLPRTLARIGVTTLVVIIALSLAGGVAYAQPGETLYPVKIAAEQVELVLATGDQAKVTVGIKHAKRRLAEAVILVQENKDSKIVEETLEAMRSTTAELVRVATTADTQPDLAVEASMLAAEQEEVLATAFDSSSNIEVKDAVQNAITAAKESKSKLGDKEDGEDVKGVASTQPSEAVSPSSTPSAIATPAPALIKPSKKDTVLDATIQIDEVITIGDDRQATPVGK